MGDWGVSKGQFDAFLAQLVSEFTVQQVRRTLGLLEMTPMVDAKDYAKVKHWGQQSSLVFDLLIPWAKKRLEGYTSGDVFRGDCVSLLIGIRNGHTIWETMGNMDDQYGEGGLGGGLSFGACTLI